MKMMWVAMALATVLSLTGCDNDCSFKERCNGDVLEICGDGPDQVVGRRVNSFPCTAPNAACAELDGDNAACVTDPPRACDKDFERLCDGDLLLRCEIVEFTDGSTTRGFLSAEDCGSEEGTAGICGIDEDRGATCVEP